MKRQQQQQHHLHPPCCHRPCTGSAHPPHPPPAEKNNSNFLKFVPNAKRNLFFVFLVQSDYLIYSWQPLGKGTCSHFSKRVLLFRLFNLLFFFHCIFLTVTSWGMFSLSSRRFENWPPCLLAPPRLDRKNILIGFVNISEIQYIQDQWIRKTEIKQQDKTSLWYLPKSNPRHQRPSLKAENGGDIRDRFDYYIFNSKLNTINHLVYLTAFSIRIYLFTLRRKVWYLRQMKSGEFVILVTERLWPKVGSSPPNSKL